MPKSAQFLPGEDDLVDDRGIDLEICQCSGCGLVQLSNDPVSYYKEVVRAVGVSNEMKEFRRIQFNNFVHKYSLEGKKVIEIGCGRGEYLSIMKDANVVAYGLEESQSSVEQCIESGIAVFKGFIQDGSYKLNDAPFDAFFILNFLEHLPDPNSTLGGIRNNLAVGAIGLIEVPNFEVRRKTLFSEFIRDHLLYFTKDTFISTLGLNGFEVLECSEVWHESIISAVVMKRGKLDLSNFNNHQTRLQNELEEYIGRFGVRRVAIWGASHQSMAIISLFDLGKKIKYVIDSATFKQGKFTPATHVRIVPPELLDADPVDAVIVMAALYSDEVANIIQKKYGNKMRIAILKDYGLEIV